jgi:hypothetical protein
MNDARREHRPWYSLIVFALTTWGAALTAPQTTVSLTSLTVPDNRLPTGCHLKPMTPPANSTTPDGTIHITAAPPMMYPSNPWSGTTTRLLVETRKRIDPPPSLYYDPPPAKANEMESQWVEHVVEAYHAIYDSAGGWSVEVWAIKFDDPKLALDTPSVTSRMLSASGPGADGRIIKRDVVVKLGGNGASTDCFKAIDNYIREAR